MMHKEKGPRPSLCRRCRKAVYKTMSLLVDSSLGIYRYISRAKQTKVHGIKININSGVYLYEIQ